MASFWQSFLYSSSITGYKQLEKRQNFPLLTIFSNAWYEVPHRANTSFPTCWNVPSELFTGLAPSSCPLGFSSNVRSVEVCILTTFPKVHLSVDLVILHIYSITLTFFLMCFFFSRNVNFRFFSALIIKNILSTWNHTWLTTDANKYLSNE